MNTTIRRSDGSKEVVGPPLTPHQAQEAQLARDAIEANRRAERERKDEEVRQYRIREEEKRRVQAEQERVQEEARSAALVVWNQENARLTVLRRRAAGQLQEAEVKADDSPMNMDLSSAAIAAEKCLLRIQLKLDAHEQVKP